MSKEYIPNVNLFGKKIFMISPIGETNSPTREHYDLVKEFIISPVAIKLEYIVLRADEDQRPGTIDDQIIRNLIISNIVVADISDENPNVYYELAVRHATGRPIILLIKADQKIPFDIARIRVIRYDINDLKSVKQAQEMLEKQILSIESGDFFIDSPLRPYLPLHVDMPLSDQDEINEILSLLREFKIDVLQFVGMIDEIQTILFSNMTAILLPIEVDYEKFDKINTLLEEILAELRSKKK